MTKPAAVYKSASFRISLGRLYRSLLTDSFNKPILAVLEPDLATRGEGHERGIAWRRRFL